MEEGLTSRGGRHLRLPLRFGGEEPRMGSRGRAHTGRAHTGPAGRSHPPGAPRPHPAPWLTTCALFLRQGSSHAPHNSRAGTHTRPCAGARGPQVPPTGLDPGQPSHPIFPPPGAQRRLPRAHLRCRTCRRSPCGCSRSPPRRGPARCRGRHWHRDCARGPLASGRSTAVHRVNAELACPLLLSGTQAPCATAAPGAEGDTNPES